MKGNPRKSWILSSTPWIPDSRSCIPILCQWNLDSGFQSVVGFRIPELIPAEAQDSGLRTQKNPGF